VQIPNPGSVYRRAKHDIFDASPRVGAVGGHYAYRKAVKTRCSTYLQPGPAPFVHRLVFSMPQGLTVCLPNDLPDKIRPWEPSTGGPRQAYAHVRGC
jgi:hypothetical protein